MATCDRFRLLIVDYPTEATERAILTKAAPQLSKDVINSQIKMAQMIRKAFVNGSLSVTMSTRTLIRWAKLTLAYTTLGDKRPIGRAFEESYFNRVGDESEIDAVRKDLTSVFPEGTAL